MEPNANSTNSTEPASVPSPEATITPTAQPVADSAPSVSSSTPESSSAPTPPYADISISSSPSAAPVVSGGDITEPAVAPVVKGRGSAFGKFGKSKQLIVGAVVAVLLIAAGAAYYFGYYNNPTVIFNQSLSNTGKGYDKLTTYLDNQSKLNYKGVTASGTYTVGSGSFATDGKLSFNSDGDNTDGIIDLNVGASRVAFDLRTIKSKTATPDIYFKVSGLDGLGSLLGSGGYGSVLGAYNDKWIVVDQALISNLQKVAASQSSGTLDTKAPTHAQVMDELDAFGKVNQQYVFTGDKSKSVFTVVKQYGKETVDGHSTYHYQVALVKENVKKYLTAQRDALKASKLNDWLKANNYENYVAMAYDSMVQAADGIKSSATFDLWADTSHRLIYKIRVADTKDPSNNYADFGLDYKGGSDYPFFIKFNSKQAGDATNGSFVVTLNTDTNATSVDASVKGSGTSSFNFKANLKAQPTNSVKPITAPTGAIKLTQVLNQLGLGSYLNLLGGSGLTTPSSSTLKAQTCADAYQVWANSNGATALPPQCQ